MLPTLRSRAFRAAGELFDLIDEDCTGDVSYGELSKAMDEISAPKTPQQRQKYANVHTAFQELGLHLNVCLQFLDERMLMKSAGTRMERFDFQNVVTFAHQMEATRADVLTSAASTEYRLKEMVEPLARQIELLNKKVDRLLQLHSGSVGVVDEEAPDAPALAGKSQHEKFPGGGGFLNLARPGQKFNLHGQPLNVTS